MESPEFWLSAGTASSLEHEHPDSPVLKGIEYSNKLIVTYQLVLLAFLAICLIWHWSNVGRQTRGAEKIAGRHSSIDAKAHDEANESSSLLSHDIDDRPRATLLRLCVRRVRACLMYQPTWHPEIQGGDTTLLVLLLWGINIFYAVYQIPFSMELIMVSADRAGLLFASNLPWLYLLAAKNQPFKLLTGYSYESLNILHRSLGKWLAVLSIFHTVGMVLVWSNFLLPRGLDLWWYLSRNIIWIGLLAFISFQILAITSHVLFRQWWYEMFLGCHIVLQASGLTFLFFHHSRLRPYVGIALAIFLLDRLVYRLMLKTRTFDADLTIMQDRRTVMVSASWPLRRSLPTSWSWLTGRRDIYHGWRATDHVFLTVPALGRKHALQAHPFTIASAAPEPEQEHAWFNLIIRVQDGFTKDLLRYATEHFTAKIRLDGPYGSAHALEMLQSSDSSIVIAGGSGIAVAYPLLWKLLHDLRKQHNSAVNACLIWIIQDANHTSWLGFERLQELEQLGLKVVIPPPTSKAGRPDIQTLLRDQVQGLGGESIGVIVSGPDAMNRAVKNTCASMAWHGMDINVVVEVFDW